MQFDWYQATLNAPPDRVFSAMEKSFPHSDLRPGRPSNGYTHGAELVLGDTLLLRSMWGGVNGGDTTHCVATGGQSPAFATFARSHFADHQVSRLDVAIDYQEEGSFARLSKALVGYAKTKKLKTATAGDWIKHEGGKTLYLGSRSSSAYLRLYEKGKQLGMDANPHWTRCELEVKPGSREGKAFLATATPEACWGAARWTLAVNELLGNLGVSRAPVGTVHTPTDDERALHYLVKQYGPLLQRIYHLCGDDWALVGEYLGRRINPAEFGLAEHDGQAFQLDLF